MLLFTEIRSQPMECLKPSSRLVVSKYWDHHPAYPWHSSLLGIWKQWGQLQFQILYQHTRYPEKQHFTVFFAITQFLLTVTPAFHIDFCDSGLSRYSPIKKVANTAPIINQTNTPQQPSLFSVAPSIVNTLLLLCNHNKAVLLRSAIQCYCLL